MTRAGARPEADRHGAIALGLLADVLAERRTRDAGRLRRETALRERVVPADPVA